MDIRSKYLEIKQIQSIFQLFLVLKVEFGNIRSIERWIFYSNL